MSTLIAETMRQSNSADYPLERLEPLIAYFTPERLVALARERDCIVVEEEGRIVGTAALEGAELVTFFVHPDWQRIGIGTALLDTLESHARRAGLPRITVEASLTGASFYERRGYRRTGHVIEGTAGPQIGLEKVLRDSVAGVPIEIRASRPGEADVLTGIARRAKRHWGYPSEWMDVWRSALTLTPEYLREHRLGVAERRGEPVGFYALEHPSESGALWSLAHLWVDPAWHNHGIGRSLFLHAASVARAAGGAGLEIHSDPHAVPFYERLGARRSGAVAAPVPGDAGRTLPVFTYTWGAP